MSGEYPRLLKKRAVDMLELAERLFRENKYDLTVLHAEYAARLYLKSLLYRLTGEEYRGHCIRALLALLAEFLEDEGFDRLADDVRRFAAANRRLLAELEEGHTRAVYGVFEYSRSQAEKLLHAARELVNLLLRIERGVFGEAQQA